MQKGSIKPTKADWKDKKYHFHRLFGTTTNYTQTGFPVLLKDQNSDNRPSECTAYTITTLSQRINGVERSHDYQFMKTLEIMDVPPNNDGADPRTAASVAVSFGVLNKTLEPASMPSNIQAWAANEANWPLTLDPFTTKLGAYSPIVPDIGQDWFDAFRSVLSKGHTIGLATQWSPSFEAVDSIGILTDNPVNLYWGHMYEVFDWCEINGQFYLKLNTWQGSSYGQGGVVYASRVLINKLMVLGTYAVTLQADKNLYIEKESLLEAIIGLLQASLKNLLIIGRYGIS